MTHHARASSTTSRVWTRSTRRRSRSGACPTCVRGSARRRSNEGHARRSLALARMRFCGRGRQSRTCCIVLGVVSSAMRHRKFGAGAGRAQSVALVRWGTVLLCVFMWLRSSGKSSAVVRCAVLCGVLPSGQTPHWDCAWKEMTRARSKGASGELRAEGSGERSGE